MRELRLITLVEQMLVVQERSYLKQENAKLVKPMKQLLEKRKKNVRFQLVTLDTLSVRKEFALNVETSLQSQRMVNNVLNQYAQQGRRSLRRGPVLHVSPTPSLMPTRGLVHCQQHVQKLSSSSSMEHVLNVVLIPNQL